MNIKHRDLEATADDPFKHCKLDRKKNAEILTSIVENFADGFVLAIDNQWGTGKTTFVKMWRQGLENQGFKTMYLNAWETDFENDPMTAIMAELSTLKSSGTEEILGKVIKKGALFTRNLVPILIKALAAKYVDVEVLKDLVGDVADNLNDELSGRIESYLKAKDQLGNFKQELVKYIEQTKNGKPVVLIVDELDRCRPNYAVEMLEKIKHFFNVPGIVFVLAIDKIQLGNAVRGVYGSDLLDADEYLRRFIDLQYNLPKPNSEQYCSYLCDYFGFEKIFNTVQRKSRGATQDEYSQFVDIASSYFNIGNYSLRQQEKFLAHARIALSAYGNNEAVVPSLFITLQYLKENEVAFYRELEEKKYSLGMMATEFQKIIGSQIHSRYRRLFSSVGAQLIYAYNNSLQHRPDSEYKYRELIHQDSASNKRSVSLGFGTDFDQAVLDEQILFLNQSGAFFQLNIDRFHEVIGLTADLKFNL